MNRRRSLCRLVASMSLLGMGMAAAAGAAPWTAIAPQSGTVTQLAVEPRSGQVFAATERSGLYRSGDHGASWSAAGRSLGPQSVQTLLAAPGAVYALTLTHLFKSTDGGASWSSLAEEIFDLALAPSAPNTLYAAGPGGQAARSDDGGITFRPVGNLADLGVYSFGALAVDPTNANVIYGYSNLGLVTSRDGGAHWAAVGSLTNPDYYHQLTVDPADPATLYVLAAGKLLRSSDRGAHWREIGFSFPRGSVVAAVAVAAGPTPRLYAAILRSDDAFLHISSALVYRSDDQGEHWRQLARTSEVRALAVDPAHPERVYAGTVRQGVLWSANSGAGWSRGGGLRDLPVRALAADRHVAGTVYLLSALGLQKSADGGRTWADLGEGTAIEISAASRVIADPKAADMVYVVAGDATNDHRTTLFASTDGGASWQPRGPLPAGLAAEDLAIDPERPRHLIAAGSAITTGVCGIDCFFPPRPKAYDSRDGGVTWTSRTDSQFAPTAVGIFTGVRFDPADSQRVFLIGDHCLRSHDGGATWTPLNLGEPLALKDLAIDPAHSSVFYGASSRLLKSTDAGRHWLPVAALPDPVERVVLDARSGVVYAATGGRGVWSSGDGGAHWAPVGSGLPSLPPSLLAADPFRSGHLWAGYPGFGGLYSSPR